MFLYVSFLVFLAFLVGLTAGFLVSINNSIKAAVVSGGVVSVVFFIVVMGMSAADMKPVKLKCSGIESTGGYSVCQLGNEEVRIAGKLGTKTMDCTREDYGSPRLICSSGTEKTMLVSTKGNQTYDMWERK